MITVAETKDHRLLAGMSEEIQTLHHTMYPAIFKPFSHAEIAGFFEQTLKKPETMAFMAYADEAPVGYALIFIQESAENPFKYASRSIHLDQLLVSQATRKLGVAQLLMDKVYEVARERNIDVIDLNHWTDNAPARRFFAKNGFSYYQEKMMKRLD